MKNLILILLAIAAIIAGNSAFVVRENERAVLLQFGRVLRSDYGPGLHFKLPVLQNVRKFERRIVTLDKEPQRYLTSERKDVLVDFFVKWRITNVGEYYRSSGGNESLASQRLLEIMKAGIRGEFAKRTVPQVVAAERRELLDAMLSSARAEAASLGIEIVDVRVKRIEFSDEVSDSVFNRMRQERARVAAELRAQGAASAEQIRADADRQRTVIIATAYRDAEKLRGEGDAVAARTYADAYRRNADFFAFYRSISAYKRSLGQPNDLMVLDSKGDFFRYLRDAEGKR